MLNSACLYSHRSEVQCSTQPECPPPAKHLKQGLESLVGMSLELLLQSGILQLLGFRLQQCRRLGSDYNNAVRLAHAGGCNMCMTGCAVVLTQGVMATLGTSGCRVSPAKTHLSSVTYIYFPSGMWE